MKKKNHWKNICALFFAFCMVFSTVAGDASFVTAYAAEVQTTAGSEAAKNPSPAAESGADSTEGAQNTINQESAAQTGNAGQTDAAQAEGAVTDGCSADRWCSAGGCGTEYGVWGRPEYGAHPDGGCRKPCGLQLYGGTGSGTSGSSDSGQRNA